MVPISHDQHLGTEAPDSGLDHAHRPRARRRLGSRSFTDSSPASGGPRTARWKRPGVAWRGSQICIGLTDDTGNLIGFVRVITDYTFKALVFDVIVADAHRGKGLGDHLIKLVLEHPDLARVRHFELYCLPDVGPFYERHGFSTEVGGVRLMRCDGA